MQKPDADDQQWNDLRSHLRVYTASFVPIIIVIALSCCSSKRRRSATRYHFFRAEGFHTAEPPFCGDGGMAGTMRAGCGFIRKQRNRRFASEMRASSSMVAEEGAELLSQP